MKPEQRFFGVDDFISAAQQKWPGCEVIDYRSEPRAADADINVAPKDSSPFTVTHYSDNQMISTDGTPDQAADVAAWIRTIHPDPNLALWYIDEAFAGHTVLTPGISASQVYGRWVDHATHDPEQEYPEYFKH